jgi:hypothetical protein
MGRYVAKLGDDAYCEWSTVVDAPVSWVLTRERAVQEFTSSRVARADRYGTSLLDGYPAGETPDEIVRGNRAGQGETELSVGEIIRDYAEGNPAPWAVA